MAIRISQTSKLKARSWSLEARTTCPGSIGADGELVDACKGCYAASGNYRFKNVKADAGFSWKARRNQSAKATVEATPLHPRWWLN